MGDILDVYLGQANVGRLTLLPGDRSLFTFTEDYLNNANRPVLSQSYISQSGNILSEIRHVRSKLPPFFSNLLPEGHLRTYIAEQGGVKPSREFRLIELLGNDLPGAVRVVPPDGSPLTDEPEKSKGSTLKKEHLYRFSLAGVQLKFSALSESTGGLTIPTGGVGGDWIVKLPAQNFAHVPENEWSMLHLAEAIGISVPEIRLVPLTEIAGLPDPGFTAGDMALAIQRFDRGNGQRIHIEDFAQVYNVFPHNKYEKVSYDNIANMIWLLTGEQGLIEFIRRLTFTIMIGNGDMHLKNWSLIYADGYTAEISPAYDFVSTIPYLPDDRLALNLAGEKNMTTLNINHFKRLARKAEVPRYLVTHTAQETATATREKWSENKDSYGLPGKIRKRIELHLNKVRL